MQIVVNRLSKIFGTVVKGVSYIFHFFLPNKRFEIPLYSPALIKSSKKQKIPKKIWQTNYSNRSTLPIYINYLFNRLLSLDWEYHYVSTQDREKFIKKHATQEQYEAFLLLTDGAAQADFWRLLVLIVEGGVYMDIDAHLVWPLSWIIKEADDEVILLNKEHYTNYFIAAIPNNKSLIKTLNLIVDNIQKRKIENGVYSLTGPKVLNDAIGDDKVTYRYYKYTCIQGSFTNEYFQYLDKPRGKWIHAKKEDLLKT